MARIAGQILDLDKELKQLGAQIEELFRQHPDAENLLSVPGFGPLLGAEFLAQTGADMSIFTSADRLAAVAGLAPVPRDSGRISGNLHRPKRYNRRLLRTCYMAADVASRSCPTSRAYYQRKRAEGKNHKQAILALARRRINVIWAIFRDRTPYQPNRGTTLQTG